MASYAATQYAQALVLHRWHVGVWTSPTGQSVNRHYVPNFHYCSDFELLENITLER